MQWRVLGTCDIPLRPVSQSYSILVASPLPDREYTQLPWLTLVKPSLLVVNDDGTGLDLSCSSVYF